MAPLAQAQANAPTCNGIDTRALTTSQLVDEGCYDSVPSFIRNEDIRTLSDYVGSSYGFDAYAGAYPGRQKEYYVKTFDDGDWPDPAVCESASDACSLADAIEACNASWFEGARTGGCTIKFDGLVKDSAPLDPNGTSNGLKANNVMDLALGINRLGSNSSVSTRKHRVMAIKAPYVTIDGISATGFVPTVSGAEIKIMTRDVLIQNLRILPGRSSSQSPFTTARTAWCGSEDSFASEPDGEGFGAEPGCPYSEVGPPSAQQSAIRLVSQLDNGLEPGVGFSVPIKVVNSSYVLREAYEVCDLHSSIDDSDRLSAESEYHLTDHLVDLQKVGAGGGVWTHIGRIFNNQLWGGGTAVQWFAKGGGVTLPAGMPQGKLLACLPQPVRNVVIDSVDIGWAGDTVFNTYANVPFAFDTTSTPGSEPKFTVEADTDGYKLNVKPNEQVIDGKTKVYPFEITSYTMSDITVSRSFIGQGTLYAGHPKGPHSSNMLVNEGIRRFAGLNNVFHNSKQGRNPLVYGGTTSVWVNNIFADLGSVTSPPGQFFAQPNPAADEYGNGPLRIWQSNMTVGDYLKAKGEYKVLSTKGGELPSNIGALNYACQSSDSCTTSNVDRILDLGVVYDTYDKDGFTWYVNEWLKTGLDATTWGFSVKSIGVFSGHRDEASFTVNSGVIAGVGPKYNKFYYDDRAMALNAVLGDTEIESYVPLSAALSFDSTRTGSEGIVSAALTAHPVYKKDASGSCTPFTPLNSVQWFETVSVLSGYTHGELNELQRGLYSDEDCQIKASFYMTGIPSKGTAVWEWDKVDKQYEYLYGSDDLNSPTRSSVKVNEGLLASQGERNVQHATCPLVFAVAKDVVPASDYACYIGGVYVGNVSGAPAATGMVHGKVIKACQDLVAQAVGVDGDKTTPSDSAMLTALANNEYFPILLYSPPDEHNTSSGTVSLPDEFCYAYDDDGNGTKDDKKCEKNNFGYYESKFDADRDLWVPRSIYQTTDPYGVTYDTTKLWDKHEYNEWYMDGQKLLATRYVPMVEVSRSTDLRHKEGDAYGGHVCSNTSASANVPEEGFFPVWYTPKVNVHENPRSGMYIRQ
jgi:hypothetical protein